MPGPRIYNLFPLLAGPVPQWSDHLERIAAMAFDWVFVNPFHYPGFSGSLYAVKDYYRLHPLLAADGADPESLLKGFTRAAAKRRIAVMMDLVINHTVQGCGAGRGAPGVVPPRPRWRAALAARDRSDRSAQVHRVGRPRRDRLRQSEHAPGADRVLGGAGRAPPEARLQGVPLRRRLPGAGRGVAADRSRHAKALDPGVPVLRRDARLHAGPGAGAARAPASTSCSTAPSGGTSARPGCSSSTTSTARSRRPSPSRRATTPSASRSSSATPSRRSWSGTTACAICSRPRSRAA